MTRPTRIEIDCSTGIETIYELTDEEIAQNEAVAAAWETERLARDTEIQAKADARASAQAKLAALGLTVEEIAALS